MTEKKEKEKEKEKELSEKKRTTKDTVRKIRFAFLSKTEDYIANQLKISPRGWHKVKTGNGNFSERLLHKVNILLRVHRPSPIKLFESDVTKLANYAIKNTGNIDDLKAIFKCMERMLGGIDMDNSEKDSGSVGVKHPTMQDYLSSDYGFLGLCGSLAFALWIDGLESLLTTHGCDQQQQDTLKQKSLDFLKKSIKCWEEAYKNTKDDSIKDIFKINYTSAKIWKETFFDEKFVFNPKGKVNGNKEYSEVFHKIASKNLFKNLIPLRIDALEQAAVLKDQALIDNDLTILFDLLKKSIPLKEQDEVVLPKLKEMHGYTEVEKRPSFKEWVSSLEIQE